MLNIDETRAELIAAIRSFIDGSCSLDDLRESAERIADEWRTASPHDLPPSHSSENALWSVLWEVISGCHEAISREGLAQQLRYLSGEAPLPSGTRGLRP